jgi:hypothetical protein
VELRPACPGGVAGEVHPEAAPPRYNYIWAVAHPLHGRLRMDGDVKVLWQNIRALMWMLDRMREVPERELVEERATRV